MDIRDIKALRNAADTITQKYGKIDIVVANAAIQRWKSLLEMDDAEWYDVINNNVNGTQTPFAKSDAMDLKKKCIYSVVKSCHCAVIEVIR